MKREIITASRKQARELNAKYYRSGDPCKRSSQHSGVRYVNDGKCIDCNRAYYLQHKVEADAIPRKRSRVIHDQTGQVFPSIPAAAKQFNLAISTVWYSINYHCGVLKKTDLIKGQHSFTRKTVYE